MSETIKILGAVMAGGGSTRFGSDKAAAMLCGRTLLEHICDALIPQVDEVVICGRSSLTLRSLPDRPAANMGPLGGINAALHDARARGYSHVVTVPVDVLPLPLSLVECLRADRPQVLRSQHLVGCWPCDLAPDLDQHLEQGYRSVRSWINRCEAQFIDDSHWNLRNINHVTDL